MRIVAFDSKDFNRGKIVRKPAEPPALGTVREYKGYFTPLGVGLTFKHEDLFRNAFVKACSRWAAEFSLSMDRPVLSSYPVRSHLPLKAAIPLCDKIIQEVQEYIELAFFSWISLPLDQYPTVEVGGQRTPRKEIPTPKFLRDVAPSFSYMTAWSFFGKRNASEYAALVDGFRGKVTTAWTDLTSRTKPQVYSRGDECNPFIAAADMVAFLTDVKLWQAEEFEKRKLIPESVKSAWNQYQFDVDVRYLDPNVLSKIAWYSENLIDVGPYLKRPVIFFLADEIEKIELAAPGPLDFAQTELPLESLPPPKPRRFHDVLQRTAPYVAATQLAFERDGCVQFFDRYTDTDKIRDGDVLVYMGEQSRRVASAYEDAYEVEVMSARELRRRLKRESIKEEKQEG